MTKLSDTIKTTPAQQLEALNDIWIMLDQIDQKARQTNELLAAILDATNFENAKHKKGKK